MITIKGAKKTSYTVKKLKKGKVYYLKVCPYKLKKGNRYSGIYTSKKKVKIKV